MYTSYIYMWFSIGTGQVPSQRELNDLRGMGINLGVRLPRKMKSIELLRRGIS